MEECAESLEDRLKNLQKEYDMKIRKLKKNERSSRVRAYVQQRLQEEADEQLNLKSNCRKVVYTAKDAGSDMITDLDGLVTVEKTACTSVSDNPHLPQPVYTECDHGGTKTNPASNNIMKNSNIKTKTMPTASNKNMPNCTTKTIPSASNKNMQNCETTTKCDTEESIEMLDISPGSQDIFISPPKPKDNRGPTIGGTIVNEQTSKLTLKPQDINALPNHDDVEDQVMVVSCSSSDRGKTCSVKPVSKLKLSKYKRKNFVNFLETKQIDVKENLVSDSLVTDKFSSDVTKTMSPSNVIELEPDLVVSEQVRPFAPSDLKNLSMAGNKKAVLQETQNLIPETDSSCSISNSQDSLVLNSDNTFISDASPFDNNVKLKRRSGSRKRHSSSFGSQRRSSRIAGQSSHDSSSPSLEVVSPLFVDIKESSSKRRVVISSMFQCLVDEGKRKSGIEEFSIPRDILPDNYNGKISNITFDSQTCNKPDTVSLKENLQSSLNDNVVYKETNFIALNQRENTEQASVVGTEHSLKRICDSEMLKVKQSNQENVKEEFNSPTFLKSGSETGADGVLEDNAGKVLNSAGTGEEQKFPDQKCDIEMDTEMSCAGSSVMEIKHDSESGMTSDELKSCLHLKQQGMFELAKSDQIHWLSCMEIEHEGKPQLYVVCQCSSCLKLFTVCNSQWTCVANTKLTFTTKKKLGQVMYPLPDSDNVSVILLHTMTNCSSVNLYTHSGDSWKQQTLDKIYSKSIQVCPLSWKCVIIGYYSDLKSYLTKYSKDTRTGQWSNTQLDSTDQHISQLIPVTGIEAAVLVLMKSAQLHIWNHEHGFLLTSVDLSDLCPQEPLCCRAFSEQGFLFMPVLSRKKGCEVGSIIVVNPYLGTSETLTSIQTKDVWTGCSNACVMSEGLLLSRQTNGCVRIWDVYSGDSLATINDVKATCFSATNQHLVLAHKQCVHVYRLHLPESSEF